MTFHSHAKYFKVSRIPATAGDGMPAVKRLHNPDNSVRSSALNPDLYKAELEAVTYCPTLNSAHTKI